IEKSARTVDEAVAEALRELGARRDQVEIEALEEGSKGLFGLLGAKQARVRARAKEGAAAPPSAAATAAAERAQAPGAAGRAVDVARDAVDGADGGWDSEWEIGGDCAGEDAGEAAARPVGPPGEARVARAREVLPGVLERMDVAAALENRIAED